MLKKTLLMSALASALAIAGSPALADEQERAQKEEQVYGSQMMTEQERKEHRAKMRAAKTAEEREHLRKEHHEKMKARAKERGITLPDEPPARGGSMSPGGGMGPKGGGMGPKGGY